MRSTLTVTTSATTIDLTTEKTVRDELGLDRSFGRDKLRRWIHDASAFVASHCGRTLAKETVTESFWLQTRMQASDTIRLERWPVVSVASVTLDDTALTADTDYVLDDRRGLLLRLDSLGGLMPWLGTKLVVAYTAGFDLIGSLNREIEEVTIQLLRMRLLSGDRDPTIRSEATPMLTTTYWIPGPDQNGAMPPDLADKLSPFVERRI